MTMGFPTIVIPAVQIGRGHGTTHHSSDFFLTAEEISWFSEYF